VAIIKERKMSAENQNIQVVVRCRGRNAKETSIKSPVVINVDDEESNEVVLNPSNDTGVSAQLNSKTYAFDKVFGPMSDQKAIFERVAAPLFNEFLKGYNCTMLVYGMTSTGKTYTMSGEDRLVNGELSDKAGVIPRVLFKLFDVLNDSKQQLDTDYIVKCSFVEIYNEDLKDLLSDELNKKLRIFDQKSNSTNGSQSPTISGQSFNNNKSTIHIQNLEEVILRNANHGIKTLQKGLKIRQVASTKMNDVSSRSHTIFTLSLYKKNGDSNDLFRISKMNLVDLAGSENISRSGALNQRAKEAGSINQSLLTLGRVINLLVEKNQHHIPYRESKLTRILQDSLGGRTKTCLIATISPAKVNYEETLSTLEYANKAKNIENKPQLGLSVGKDILLKELSAELSRLKSDLSATRLKGGYHMDKDNHDELMNEIQESKTEVNEIKRSSELLKKQNESLKKKMSNLESRNNENITMINTLNATVESLHNKIDKQKQNEQSLMMSSSKFKHIINSINSNLTIFKKYESDAKREISIITEDNIKKICERVQKIINENSSNLNVNEVISNVQNEFDQMIIELQKSTYDACKNVGDSILSKFPKFFNDFEKDFEGLINLIKNFEVNINEEFSKLSKENNDLKNSLNESLFNNHEKYLKSFIEKQKAKFEYDNNEIANKILNLFRENNLKQQEELGEILSSNVKDIISIEKSQIQPIQSKWENATCEIINNCDFQTNKLVDDHSIKLKEILKSLQKTNHFTNTSKITIDKELSKLNTLTFNFQNNNKIDDNLNELRDEFSKIEEQKINLINGLNDNEIEALKIRDHLIAKIVNNDEISNLEVRDMDKVLNELENEEKEIEKALLPTGKTPIRQQQGKQQGHQLRSSNQLNVESEEGLNKSPPKFQLIGQRFSNNSNDNNGMKISKDDDDKENKVNEIHSNININKGKRRFESNMIEGDFKKIPKLNSNGRIPLRRNRN